MHAAAHRMIPRKYNQTLPCRSHQSSIPLSGVRSSLQVSSLKSQPPPPPPAPAPAPPLLVSIQICFLSSYLLLEKDAYAQVRVVAHIAHPDAQCPAARVHLAHGRHGRHGMTAAITMAAGAGRDDVLQAAVVVAAVGDVSHVEVHCGWVGLFVV